MNQNTTFNIYIMSTQRAKLTMNLSFRLFEYATYVVRENEKEDYLKAGVRKILTIPAGAVNSFMTTFYWIIENTPEDVICIVDDDIKKIIYRIIEYDPLEDAIGIPDREKITSEFERIGQIISDLDIGLAYDNPQSALYVYDKEFAFKGMPGHVRWINKKAFKARLRPHDPATSDIDMSMQELLMNRIVLLPKYIASVAHMDKLEGDTSDRKTHTNMTHAMKNKWGRYYSYDYKKNQATINVQR